MRVGGEDDMNTYSVGVAWETRRIQIQAKNSTEAKRIFCRMTGRRFNDYWCGASILTAKKVAGTGHVENG